MSKVATIPSDLLHDSALDSIKINRVATRQQSDITSYSANQKIIFTLPNDLCDLRGSYLTFTARIFQNGGTYARFSYPIQTIFSRLRVFLGSQLVEDIQDSNVLEGIFKLCSEINSVTENNMEGSYDQTVRGAESLAGRLYTVHNRLETLRKVLPLHRIKVPLRLECTIGDPSQTCEYDGGVPTINIQQAYLNYHSLQVPQSYNDYIDALIASGNLQIKIHSFDNNQQSSLAGQSNTLMVPFKYMYTNAALAVSRNLADITNPLVNYKFTDIYNFNQLTTSYLKVANTVYPSDKYDSAYPSGNVQFQPVLNSIMNEDYSAYTRQQDTFGGQSPNTRMVIPFDLRRDSGPSAKGLWCNGVDTTASAASISLGLQYAAAIPAQSVDNFVRYEATITVLPGGSVSVSN